MQVSLWLCDASLDEAACKQAAKAVPVATIYLSKFDVG